MADDSKVARDFQRRRKETWNAVRPWLLIMAIGFIGSLWLGNSNFNDSPQRWIAAILCLTLVGVAIARIAFIVKDRYRCPACGAIPMAGAFAAGPSAVGYDYGIDLNPKQCPACRAQLR